MIDPDKFRPLLAEKKEKELIEKVKSLGIEIKTFEQAQSIIKDQKKKSKRV